MALPVSPGPKSRDVAVRGWSGITVRTAWTLLAQGVKVRADVLTDARAHAIRCIPASTPLPHAEDLAAQATRDFVLRARGRRPDDPWPQDVAMPLSPRWVRALERSTDAVGAALFRKHYGDNRPLARLESSLGVDRTHLEAARGGLREVVRRIGQADGLPFDTWPVERLDRVLERLAAFASGPCPPALDVAEGAHREHVRNCPRCDRLARLVRAGILTIDDLLPPSIGARPTGATTAIVLQFHPDARPLRPALLGELDVPAHPLGDDLLLFDGAHAKAVKAAVHTAAEVAAPHRTQLRGAWLEGDGAWSAHGLLGPLTNQIDRAVQRQTWGTAEGLGELPEPLPQPPAATGLWAGVGALAATGLVLLRLAWAATAGASPAPALQIDFATDQAGVWASFDAPDQDPVGVLVLDEELHLAAEADDAAGKAPLAVGDGSFRAFGSRGVMVVHHTDAIDLSDILAEASGAEAPLQAAVDLVRQRHPRATVAWRHR